MFIPTIIFCCIVIIIIFDNFKKTKRYILNLIELRKIPGPPETNIIVGNILPLYQPTPGNAFKVRSEWARTFYPIYKVVVLHFVFVNILSPEDCELILSNHKHMEKGNIYNVLHGWLGSGILTSTGSKWHARRKILTPAFHFNILQGFVAVFNQQANQLTDKLKKIYQNGAINVKTHITQFTLNTITETAMGAPLQNTKKDIAYRRAVSDLCEILAYRIVRPWLINKYVNFFNPQFFKEKRATKTIHAFTKEIISSRQNNFKETVIPKEEDAVYTERQQLPMLDLLLKSKKEGMIDDEGLMEEVNTFIFEGHDTTASALSFALMQIANNSNVQNQIVQEMGTILGDLRKIPTYKDLQGLKYMDRCIKEVLRLYPSVHLISRKLGEDLITSDSYLLPEGSMVVIHVFDIHRNPDIYPDPEKFDPDRFLPENCQGRHPFAYLPFSAGLRNCIGQKFAMLELKTVLCQILANFILEPVDTPSSIVFLEDLILKSKNGVKVRFIPRT